MNEVIQAQIKSLLDTVFKVGDWSVLPEHFGVKNEGFTRELSVVVVKGSSDEVGVTFFFQSFGGEGEEEEEFDLEFIVGNGDWASPLQMHEALGVAISWLRSQDWYKTLNITGENHTKESL